MGVEGQKWKGDWFDVEAEVNVGGGNKIARLRQGHVSLSKACKLVSQWQYNTHTHVSRSHDPATLASPRVTGSCCHRSSSFVSLYAGFVTWILALRVQIWLLLWLRNVPEQQRTFIQMRTVLKVVDNSGAKKVMCIQALKGKKGARLGDTIVASVKEAHPNGKVKKGKVVYGVVVRAAMQKGRCDGSEVKFDDNAVVLVDKQGQPIGTRVFGPIGAEARNFLTMRPNVYPIGIYWKKKRSTQKTYDKLCLANNKRKAVAVATGVAVSQVLPNILPHIIA
ncbi:50S ribosomal protein HLP, mitochondrial, partial [Cucurbita argyrosperma subsp. argyrosperma]